MSNSEMIATTVLGQVKTVVLDARKTTKVPGQFLQGFVVVLVFGAMSIEAIRDPDIARSWLVCLGLLAVFIGALGLWMMHDVGGVLISNRNLMSMSRVQMTLWTLVIFPALFVLALQRGVHRPLIDALAISVPRELWAALGISITSLVGTPLLLAPKTDQTPSENALEITSTAINEPKQDISAQAQGTLYSNPKPSDARISDMFQGDEVGNTGYIDPAKVQMFVLTVVLVITYAMDLFQFFSRNNSIFSPSQVSLPPISPSAIALLGISHAGYLTSKAVSHTDQKTGQQ